MIKNIKTYSEILCKELNFAGFFIIIFSLFALPAALISSCSLLYMSITSLECVSNSDDLIVCVGLLIVGAILMFFLIIAFKELYSVIINCIKKINKNYYQIRCQQTKQQCSMIKSYEIPQIQLNYRLRN